MSPSHIVKEWHYRGARFEEFCDLVRRVSPDYTKALPVVETQGVFQFVTERKR